MSSESIERFQCQLCGRGSMLTKGEAKGRAAEVTRQWYADGRATATPATRSQLEDLIAAALLGVGSAPSLSDAIKEVCTWTKYKESDEFGFDHYSTTCGRDTGNSGEFAPAWTHCPYCGKTLKVENG